MTKLLRRVARWIVREEVSSLQQEIGSLKLGVTQWRQWALVQERYHTEVIGECPGDDGPFRKWFFKTYPTKDMLP